MEGYRIETQKDRLTRHRIVPQALEPGPGEAVARIALAAITANNVTYAVHHGPPLHYGRFFPAADPARLVVPLWGFATITQSRAADLAEGTRFYGYWPSASHLKLQPGPVGPFGFGDMAAHRQGLAEVYNRYVPAHEAAADRADEPFVALFRPLFGTAHALDDALGRAPAAPLFLVTSASAKTALGTAFLLGRRGLKVVGLTSAANREFVRRTGIYDRILGYDEIAALDPDRASVLIDIAGDGAVQAAIHDHVRGLVASHRVGDTHWARPAADRLAGPQPQWFFAPTAIAAMVARDGATAVRLDLAARFDEFHRASRQWLTIATTQGPDGFATAFDPLVEGRSDPAMASVWLP